MVALRNVSEKFHTIFEVIEGGRGYIRGVLSPTDQNSQPAYVFVQPRHVFRTVFPTALEPGMIIRAKTGSVFIVGENGPAETSRGVLWQSFRLFEATGRYMLRRAVSVKNKITGAPTATVPTDVGFIWAALEPLERELADREIRVNFEQRRVIAGVPLFDGDILDNHTITKVDKQLGVSIGVLT